jgi:pentatricopeptide repeat protein
VDVGHHNEKLLESTAETGAKLKNHTDTANLEDATEQQVNQFDSETEGELNTADEAEEMVPTDDETVAVAAATVDLIFESKDPVSNPALPLGEAIPIDENTGLQSKKKKTKRRRKRRKQTRDVVTEKEPPNKKDVNESETAAEKRPVRLEPGRSYPTVEEFKILMRAFKNSKELQFDTVPGDIFKIMSDFHVAPTVGIYNILIQACIRDCRWRRAVGIIRSMGTAAGTHAHISLSDSADAHTHAHPSLSPDAQTFVLLSDCCRHAIDEPAMIFETLRLEKFPVK